MFVELEVTLMEFIEDSGGLVKSRILLVSPKNLVIQFLIKIDTFEFLSKVENFF